MFFEIKEVFDAFGPGYNKSIINPLSSKTKAANVQSSLVGAFAVRITMYKISNRGSLYTRKIEKETERLLSKNFPPILLP